MGVAFCGTEDSGLKNISEECQADMGLQPFLNSVKLEARKFCVIICVTPLVKSG